MGHLAVLEVADTGKMGAFLEWGLEKDLFLPFKEQTAKVQKGDKCLVALYVDKSGRLCATMKVYHMLRTDSPYQKDDQVKGIVYDRSDEFGVFVAVDHQFSARIPKKDVFGKIRIGDEIEARVTNVKEDGKLDLSVRGKIPQQMDADAELILKRIQSYDGVLPFNGYNEERNREERGQIEMKVQNITDIDAFFKVVDNCKGRVELVTGEGDRLNLKSKLSQYVSMANIFSNGEIPELEIIAYEPEDTERLINFMINGE